MKARRLVPDKRPILSVVVETLTTTFRYAYLTGGIRTAGQPFSFHLLRDVECIVTDDPPEIRIGYEGTVSA